MMVREDVPIAVEPFNGMKNPVEAARPQRKPGVATVVKTDERQNDPLQRLIIAKPKKNIIALNVDYRCNMWQNISNITVNIVESMSDL